MITDLERLYALETPAFVYDRHELSKSARHIRSITDEASISLLFSLKSFCFADGLKSIAPHVDGFAVSSIFEARLARSLLQGSRSIHLTSPGLRVTEADLISGLCDFVAFNSIPQWERLIAKLSRDISCGLRVNPQLSFVEDEMYAPCRPYSKLGIPIEALAAFVHAQPTILETIDGLHFHTNCDSRNFCHILETVKLLNLKLGSLLTRLSWVNMGGGYLFQEAFSLAPFYQAVHMLRAHNPGLRVYVEPGASIARGAGYIVARVIDLFENDKKVIAVLDTTVNHMPEVFEYQFQPDVAGSNLDGPYEYSLAGCSCLAGDVFGAYRFPEPLRVDSRVVFCNMGAYSHVKSHMFNGINLPTIYSVTESENLELQKIYTFDDFARLNGADGVDCI